MLTNLRIGNLAIIREASLAFSPGLTVVTGETGAGKSLLVDSLSLLLGERSSPERVRVGEDLAFVEAAFDVSGNDRVQALLRERGWKVDGQGVTLRREILAEGRGRCQVGDRAVSLADLRLLGECLVELHGQHEHQSLLRTSEHLRILDEYADHETPLKRMREAHRSLAQVRERLESLTRDSQEMARRIDMLRFQVDEIRRAEVGEGEVDRLRSERLRLRNREKVLALARAGVEALYEGESSALGALEAALSSAKELAAFDSEVAAALPLAEEARPALRELAEAMRRCARDDDEGVDLDSVEERLALIERLLKKYGPDEDALRGFLQRREEELNLLASEEGSEDSLRLRWAEAGRACADLAEDLSRSRRRAAKGLSESVKKEFSELALEGSDFDVEFLLEEDPDSGVSRQGVPMACTSSGWDRVQFLLRANPGEPSRPLSRVASGGELSRIVLAIHLALNRGSEGIVRVFDEVDAGIGGRVARVVGRKLKDLGRGGQVICVTHLPQIASLGDHHVRVGKEVRRGRTEVRVEPLDREASVREVARMMGGEKVSDLTLKHATELVEGQR